MKLVMIGTGNVATVLSKKCLLAGHNIIQIAGRTASSTQYLANLCNAAPITDLHLISKDADLYIIAIPDSGLAGLTAELRLDKQLVVHTAGSVSKEILRRVSRNYGILYPVQSLRREMTELPEVPFLVDGNTPEDLALITEFAESISSDVKQADDEKRLHLHVAAVIVSNFTNHLYTLAEQYCLKEKVDFGMLHPLIEEVAGRIRQVSPSRVQTGPAIRQDELTIQKHLDLLKDFPDLREIYAIFTNNIRKYHQ